MLGNLYLLTVGEDKAGDAPVPLPALAASVIVPDGMAEPSNDVLEQVSDAMMRLDDQFRMLEPVGLVEYQPVDEALMADADEEPAAPVDDTDVARYGLVRLTPLGLYGLRARLLEAGFEAPAVGDLADKGADALLDGTAAYPPAAAHAETEHWLERRRPLEAARELLAAARGSDEGAPLRRLRCQQALSLVGGAAEPALREVLDDAELGGLARVWLAEHGASDVPPPSEAMIFWLTVDTVAAQLAAEGNSEELRALVEGLARQHSGFFDTAWRVDHPATADVLEAMGRLHSDKKIAKEARKAAFKARSQQGVRRAAGARRDGRRTLGRGGSEGLRGGLDHAPDRAAFTNSPIAVMSHSPEYCRISFAIITPVCGSALVRSKRTSSSPVDASIRRQYALATSVNFWPEKEFTVKTRPETSMGRRPRSTVMTSSSPAPSPVRLSPECWTAPPRICSLPK